MSETVRSLAAHSDERLFVVKQVSKMTPQIGGQHRRSFIAVARNDFFRVIGIQEGDPVLNPVFGPAFFAVQTSGYDVFLRRLQNLFPQAMFLGQTGRANEHIEQGPLHTLLDLKQGLLFINNQDGFGPAKSWPRILMGSIMNDRCRLQNPESKGFRDVKGDACLPMLLIPGGPILSKNQLQVSPPL
jgi:hypothetical protein